MKLSKAAGLVIRWLICAAIFGHWQHNYAAGIFMFLFLISIDDAARNIDE